MKAPVFKTEAALWEMLKDRTKTWDARKYDQTDPRVQALTKGVRLIGAARFLPVVALPSDTRDSWIPSLPVVGFLNKETQETAYFRLLECRFAYWAEGWFFMLLGEEVPGHMADKM